MNIAIAGYGVEGKANYQYWAQFPEHHLTIVDERLDPNDPTLPEQANVITGAEAFTHLEPFDLIIRTAGLAPYKLSSAKKVWSGTNEFFEKSPAPIIGVTGSKGKGTTASFIASMLEAAGKKVWLVGNIGVPAISLLSQIKPEDIIVYELSSFQLWDIERSPQTAVVLYIEQEHLDVHRSMEEYVEAKARITKYQTAEDRLVYYTDNQYSRSIAEASKAQKIPYQNTDSAHVRGDAFYYGDIAIAPTEIMNIKGAHNLSNACAAIDAVWHYTQDTTAIAKGLAAFKGLPHRLAFLKTVHGVDYYDDSIATTPSSAIAAIKAFPGRSKVIILGGSSKGSDFSELAATLAEEDVTALLIGDEAYTIARALDAVDFKRYELLENASAQSFTRRAFERARSGGVVLLSPGAASFGMFKNYADRGEQFIAAVESLV